jgi:pimeloyl-ACP methyl ester carboxylesterase
MTIDKPVELRFEINGMTFAAQEWGDPDGIPVLALHGWLDNSNSFHRLAPLLDGVRLVAIDKAGHGESDHRSGFTPYGIWEDVAEVYSIAQQLGWDKFSLLGHSRGGVISCLVAGTFPEQVESVFLLDSIVPEPLEEEKIPQQLQQSILDHCRERSQPVYPDLERIIKARQSSVWPLSRDAAEALLSRGIRRKPEGYTWSSDPRLLNASPLKLSIGQVKAFLNRLSMPVKLLMAEDGLYKQFERLNPLLNQFPAIDVQTSPGGHHFHMEQEVDRVASEVNQFYQSIFS